jgi:isopenicillin N synthase-like dioxygenase
MADSELSLPIISITPYLLPTSDPTSAELRQKTSAALHEACVKYGFFYLEISSFIDVRETDELTHLAREFFALPQEEKNRLSLKNEDHARGQILLLKLNWKRSLVFAIPLFILIPPGYAQLHENMTAGKTDNHEGMDFYRPVEVPDKTKPVWGSNQWPTVTGFRTKYEEWVEKMKALGLIVMEAYVPFVVRDKLMVLIPLLILLW